MCQSSDILELNIFSKSTNGLKISPYSFILLTHSFSLCMAIRTGSLLISGSSLMPSQWTDQFFCTSFTADNSLLWLIKHFAVLYLIYCIKARLWRWFWWMWLWNLAYITLYMLARITGLFKHDMQKGKCNSNLRCKRLAYNSLCVWGESCIKNMSSECFSLCTH